MKIDKYKSCRDFIKYIFITLEDESRFGEGAFKYTSNTFLGMPGDTVMLVPKK